jgi:glutamate 5-kinase
MLDAKGHKAAYKRIVLKLGTSLLTGGSDHLDIAAMSGLAAQIASAHNLGTEIVIVTSGAVAAGRHALKMNADLKGLPLRQVLAAVGQGRLMQIYEELFEKYGITVAQALLTKDDLSERAGYLNARNTFMSLLELGIIGIVNENDVVAVEELEGARFGDNDNLSAMVANLVDADLLVILSDIDGLYTSDPHSHADARLISEVSNIDAAITSMAGGTKGSLGTGGMFTKVEAAKVATSCGATVAIANGREKDVIVRLAEGESIGTRFIPTTSKIESRARWMLSGLCTQGRVGLDNGAVKALLEQNKSLLPAGIASVAGEWERGDIIDLCHENGERIGSGIANYNASDVIKIRGKRSTEISSVLGYDYGAEVVHRNNMALIHRGDNGAR